ncbi:MAG TPA: glycosyltransferase [Solirubrobacteraceae bacterium]|nr:glycosyltransferase [Solirubrobacteraceae bacterium]
MSVAAGTGGFRPVKLVTIDVEHCPESISGSPAYGALWALVRERGRPRGMIQLPFGDGPLSAEELGRAIASLPPAIPAGAARRPMADPLPSISVVIPSLLERLDGLARCLRSLAALDYPDYEVIVVDNRPPGAPESDLPGARVVRETEPGISAARNRGLAAARGEIVAFTDDDVEVDLGWLRAIGQRLLDHPEEACVTGLALPRELQTAAQVGLEEYYGGFGPRTYEPVSHRMRVARPRGADLQPATVDAIADDGQVRRSFSLYAAGSFGPGANMAFRAQTLRELGGFDLALGAGTACRGGEDLLMFARLAWRGHAVGFEPGAIVHHTHRREDAALERQIEGYGVGYGALLTALVLEDPRHLGRMLGTAGRALSVMVSGYRRKLDSRREPNPRTRKLARLELRGMAVGPGRYLRSRCRQPR